MNTTLITSIAMGIALSACCGFRVFIPLLAASIGAYFKWIPVNAGMEWLGTLPAIISFATAAILEIAGYYIAFVDNILDTLATPLAMVAGSVVAASFLPTGEWDPLLRWTLGIIAGGGAAGTIQLGTGFLRLFSTKTTAGTGNAVVATGENLAAITGSAGSLAFPVIAAILILALVLYIFYRLTIKLFGQN
ncbi:DUF4126 domain-containing protein [Flavihumibacter stibioxidans]|uniref:DUF4126 domain-containing protein n=1 Tax=Flavihumibacter stibioxidans TaxID=1834163 RepID=A0ABR7M4V5_9BACT|nr:DUF4126 domain-containing protein [Flavihumibacter stibioxidans]MBC6490039.1 hypothetical protein [Flavihumibacter stibioxidans]